MNEAVKTLRTHNWSVIGWQPSRTMVWEPAGKCGAVLECARDLLESGDITVATKACPATRTRERGHMLLAKRVTRLSPGRPTHHPETVQ